MPPIVSSFEIACPPDEVYSYVTDPSRFPEWQDDVVRVRIQGGRPPSEGHGIGKLLPLEVIRRMAAKGAPRSYRNLEERLERGA